MEHFGLVTAEAMFHRAVPIVINKGGQKEIVTNGVDGFLFDTAEDITNTLRKLASNESCREKMAERASTRSVYYRIEEYDN